MHGRTNRFDNGPDTKQTDPMLIGMAEAAKVLGISTRTLWTLTNSGEIPHARIGRRVLFNVAALREWVNDRTKGGLA